MKKIIVLTISAFLLMDLSAQEAVSTAKKMWIGGTGAYASQNEDDAGIEAYSASGYEFGPSFGLMLSEKVAVAIDLTYRGTEYVSNSGTNKYTSTSNGYSISPFFRYYMGSNKFKFFTDFGFNFGGGSTTDKDNNTATPDETSEYSEFGMGVRPGIQYWLTNRWSIASTVGGLGYSSRTDKDATIDSDGNLADSKTSSFGLAVDFSLINFSLFFHF